MNPRPRLKPDIPFPPYSFVPGRAPHPHSDPTGHRFGRDLPAAQALASDLWAESLHYLLGIDLFNHGYYWEAHEVWESLWHAQGRRGVTATFVKGLIQLAVVGVKVRQQLTEGAKGHAKRACELFAEVACADQSGCFMGLQLCELITRSEQCRDEPPVCVEPEAKVEIVFAWLLWPAVEAG